MQVSELAIDRLPPRRQILIEMLPVPVLERVLELVEGRVLGIEKGPVLREELVIDQIRQRHFCTSYSWRVRRG
jgi:hypothetical protein